MHSRSHRESVAELGVKPSSSKSPSTALSTRPSFLPGARFPSALKCSSCSCVCPQSLDDVIKDLMAAIHRELAEKQSLSFAMSFPPNKVELTATKADGTESFVFEFPNPDARHSFEQAFEDAKKKLGK